MALSDCFLPFCAAVAGFSVTLWCVQKTLEELKERRYHVWWVITHLDLSADARAVIESLLTRIDDEIASLRKPN